MMSRWITFFGFFWLIGVVAAYFFVPYFTGGEVEKQLKHISAPAPFQLETEQQQRGWFHSSAQQSLDWSAQRLQLGLTHQITHGWMPITALNVQTTINQTRLPDWLKTADVPFPLQLDSQLFVDKSLNLKLHSAADRLQAQFEFSTDNAQYISRLQAKLDSLSLSLNQFPLTLNDISLLFGVIFKDVGTWQGQLNLLLQQGSLTLQQHPAIQWQDMQLRLEPQVKQDALDFKLYFNIPILNWANAKENGQFQWVVTGSAWQMSFIRRLFALSQSTKIQRDMLLPLFLLQEGTRFLNRQPEIKIPQLYWQLPSGDLRMNAALFVAKIDKPNPNLMQLLNALQGHIDLRFSASLATAVSSLILSEWAFSEGEFFDPIVQQAALQKQLDAWVQAGYLSLNNGEYHWQVNLEKGQLRMGEQQMPIQAIF